MAQTPIVTITPLTRRWVVITKYKTKKRKDPNLPPMIEATEKHYIDDQIEGIVEIYRKEMRRLRSEARREAKKSGAKR